MRLPSASKYDTHGVVKLSVAPRSCNAKSQLAHGCSEHRAFAQTKRATARVKPSPDRRYLVTFRGRSRPPISASRMHISPVYVLLVKFSATAWSLTTWHSQSNVVAGRHVEDAAPAAFDVGPVSGTGFLTVLE